MKSKTLPFLALLALSYGIKAQWISEASGFANSYGINCLSIVNSNVVWASAVDTSGATSVNKYTRTLNGGTTWIPGNVTGATALDISSIFGYNKDTAWVSMLDNNIGGGAIFRTNNGGTSWSKQTSATFSSPGGSTDFIYMFDKNIGVCVGDSNTGYWEIYSTLNGGTNWTRVTTGNIPANTIGEAGFENSYSVIGNTIWFGTSNGRVYKSINKGLTWTVATTGLASVTRVAFKDANNGIATDGLLLKKTTDGGNTWTTLTFTGNFYETDLKYVTGTTGTYISVGSTAMGAAFNGSSYSFDNGITWTNIDLLDHSSVAFLNSITGWSGSINTSSTVGGMFKWTGTFTSIKNDDYIKGISINAFPNPFTNQVTLSVNSENEVSTNLSVEITDVLGNTVKKKSEFIGNEIKLDRGTLSNGIYFYKVYNSNTIIGTGRLIAQ